MHPRLTDQQLGLAQSVNELLGRAILSSSHDL